MQNLMTDVTLFFTLVSDSNTVVSERFFVVKIIGIYLLYYIEYSVNRNEN